MKGAVRKRDRLMKFGCNEKTEIAFVFAGLCCTTFPQLAIFLYVKSSIKPKFTLSVCRTVSGPQPEYQKRPPLFEERSWKFSSIVANDGLRFLFFVRSGFQVSKMQFYNKFVLCTGSVRSKYQHPIVKDFII